jgi:ABC-type dipeptide/oligopeptide/nickel transport system permease subunit
MLSKGNARARATPVAAFAPGFTIALLVLCFSLLSDGLRAVGGSTRRAE